MMGDDNIPESDSSEFRDTLKLPGVAGMGVSGAILDLVCGLPSPQRERWPIMAMQAFIDDSREAGKVLVLAGYISTAERWSVFSDEWKLRLSMKPEMRSFKMNSIDLKSEVQSERLTY